MQNTTTKEENMDIPAARKIYWWVALAGMITLWGGQARKHAGHEKHSQLCSCMAQCIACGIDGIRGR